MKKHEWGLCGFLRPSEGSLSLKSTVMMGKWMSHKTSASESSDGAFYTLFHALGEHFGFSAEWYEKNQLIAIIQTFLGQWKFWQPITKCMFGSEARVSAVPLWSWHVFHLPLDCTVWFRKMLNAFLSFFPLRQNPLSCMAARFDLSHSCSRSLDRGPPTILIWVFFCPGCVTGADVWKDSTHQLALHCLSSPAADCAVSFFFI